MYWTGTLRLNAKEAPLLLKVWNLMYLAFSPMEVRVWDRMALTCNWVKIVSLPLRMYENMGACEYTG